MSKNKKWYFVCDFETKEVIDLMQVPAVYGQITGMSDMSDEVLGDLTWAGFPTKGFVEYQSALDKGINKADLDNKKDLLLETAKNVIRTKRDDLLSACDWTVAPDRFSQWSENSQQEIINYRQALRDMTENQSDYFYPTWPEIPSDLMFLQQLQDE